ncbi:hypothetical protein BEH_07765 [Priestia filamentosa]|uniref:Uncharacterized protein n=1 Tax=Priestia filamentosa TaxID=1402861 RepID=A0A0H4KGR9_9BACI|nr:hypothetical protein [Priestia filamentosa]AKO92006.1 hypothetical protein BEH_07765 [Priestia filamentosa]
MKYKARFLCDKYEVKYAINPYMKVFYIKDGEWNLARCHHGESYPVGYKATRVMEYERFMGEEVFHEEELKSIFEVGDVVKCGEDVVEILKVVKNLDGSIDYFTNKEESKYINTRETYFNEVSSKSEESNQNTFSIMKWIKDKLNKL